jgi:hypothetical protein
VVLLKMTAYFEERGYIVAGLAQPRLLDKRIRALD